VACSNGSGRNPTGVVPTLVIKPYPTTGPVVIVAIDNHFHDIHPTDHRVISADQPFTVRNDGRYRHDFTVVGTDVSVYLDPNDTLSWPRIGDVLPPGFYTVICKIHQNVGMGGNFTVVPGR
jgi:plastocyanin